MSESAGETSERDEPIRVVVTGATGRMGRTIIETAAERSSIEVAAAINRNPVEEAVGDISVEPAAELPTLLRTVEVDAVVDFTGPVSAAEYAGIAAEASVAFVTGTTGFTERTALNQAARAVPVVHAQNFAPGAAVLQTLVERAAARLPSYDVEVVETHHAGKRDAPSGTARALVDTVENARHTGGDDGKDELRRVHGREGTTFRAHDEIGVHSVRAGAVTGEHTVLFADADEQVRIEHRVGDRGAFAVGALKAAEAVVGRAPGLYGPEVIG